MQASRFAQCERPHKAATYKKMKENKVRRSFGVAITRVTCFAAMAMLLGFGASELAAQVPGEIANGSIPTVNGPITTPQTGRFFINPSGTSYVTPTTTVNVTATISNQQFTGVDTGSGNPVVMFGATNGNGNTPDSRTTYAAMTDIGSPQNGFYSNAADGSATGIDVATNQAFNIYTSLRHWAGSSTPPTNSRIYMADLTLDFSVPLTNPYLHIVGVGGKAETGFSTEIDLVTAGLSFTRLQGNTRFVVNPTQILNDGVILNSSCTANQAACGTVRLNGTNIQTVTLRLYIRGDGSNANWTATSGHAGDQWLIGISQPQTFSLSGNVFYDIDELNDSTVDGVGIGQTQGIQIYANLVEAVTGKILGSVPVNPDGTYSFNGIPAGSSVRVEISNNQGTALANPPTRVIPPDWMFTGDTSGTGPGSDGSPDGSFGNITVNGDVTNINFGLKRFAFTAAGVDLAGRVATPSGSGIPGARVVLLETNGNVRYAKTNPFGYYRFADVEAGGSVVLTVSDKRFRFANASRTVYVTDARNDLDFFADQP